MKKIFSILFVCLFAIGNLYSQKVVSTPAGYKVSGHDTKFYKNTPSGERMHFAPQEVTPEELLACPENSVHSGLRSFISFKKDVNILIPSVYV